MLLIWFPELMVTIAPVEGWFQIGLAALLSGISQTLVGFILFKLMALLAKMIPLKTIELKKKEIKR